MRKNLIQRVAPLALAAALVLSPVSASAAEDQVQTDQGLSQSLDWPALESPEASEPERDPGLTNDAAQGAEGEAQPDADPQEPEQSPEPLPQPEGEEPGADETEKVEQNAYFTAVGVLKTGSHDTYMTGFPGGYFYPGRALTRGEAAMMLYELLKEKPDASENPFSDVKDTDEARDAIVALSSIGLLNGYKDGTFKPKGSITRAEFVTILGRCFELEEGEPIFSDLPAEGSWSYPYILSATAKGWLNGYSDGTFRPNYQIKRCEAVKVVNVALDRRGEGFAADKDTQEFRDVPRDHWAFEDIAEAADPLDEPEPSPTPDPTSEPGDPVTPNGLEVGKSARVSDRDGLNVRSGPSTDYQKVTTLLYNAVVTITDISKYPWVGVKTASGITGYCHSDFLEPYTPQPTTGPSQNGTLSASSVTLHQYESLRLDAKVDSNISTMKWSSTNADVAYVGYVVPYNTREHGAMIYAKNPGTATLTFSDGAGNARATCTVTVTEAQAVRYAYGEGNVIPVNTNFDLIAITDESRDEVRFEIVSGPAKGTYFGSAYQTESRQSQKGLPENHVRVFRRTVSFGATGNYVVRAYSSKSGAYSADYYQFVVQVVAADNTDPTYTSYDSRRASGRLMEVLANFEGSTPEIKDDPLANKNPTVGCGYVVQVNTSFYNNMTPTEMMGQMINTVNNGTYATTVENFRKNNNMKMSQAQFDALTSMLYNCGPGVLNNLAYYLPNYIKNAVAPPTDASETNAYRGVLNVVSVSLYASPNAASSRLATVPKGTGIDVTGVEVYRSQTKQEVWYKTTYGGSTGWIPAGYVSLNGDFEHDLAYADSTSIATEFMDWHKGSGHLQGLLIRRMAECKIFFFGNYDEAFHKNDNYTINTYGFTFPSCCAEYDRR